MGKQVKTSVTITCDVCGADAKEYGAWFRIVSNGWDNIYGQHETKKYVILKDWQNGAVMDWDIERSTKAAETGVCLCDNHFKPLEDLLMKFVAKWNKEHAIEHNKELGLAKPAKPRKKEK